MNLNKTLKGMARARRVRGLLVMTAAFCVLTSIAQAATTTNWTGGAANDLWTDAGNWDSGVPTSGDTANILGTSGTPWNVEINGTQDISNITLTATYTTFTGGEFDQDKNITAPFTATDVNFTATGKFTKPGNVDWTRVTRPNGNNDDHWPPGNGTQIQFDQVESDTGTAYKIVGMNAIPAGAGYDTTANNSNIFQYNYVNNPNSPNTGSLSLTNGTTWESNQGFSAGNGSGPFNLNIDNSTLKLTSTAGTVTIGGNTTLTATNATLDLGINKILHLDMAPASFDGTGLTINQRSISGTVGAFETLSQDVGPWLNGYVENDGNFSFDTLILENKYKRILLQDDDDNSLGSDLEAIYVGTLDAQHVIKDISVPTEGLDLRGHNIYYQTLLGDLANWHVFDSVGGGSIQQVTSFQPIPAAPEPSTALMAGLGIALLAGRKRRKRITA